MFIRIAFFLDRNAPILAPAAGIASFCYIYLPIIK